jgi:hypothetical protein
MGRDLEKLESDFMMPDLYKAWITAKAMQNSNFINKHHEAIERDERGFAKVETLGSYLGQMVTSEKNNGQIWGGIDPDKREDLLDNKQLAKVSVFHMMTDRGMCDVIVDQNGKDMAQVYMQDQNGKNYELDEDVKKHILTMAMGTGISQEEIKNVLMPGSVAELADCVAKGRNLVPKTRGETVDRVNEARKKENKSLIEKDDNIKAEEDMQKADAEEKRILGICASAGITMDQLEKLCDREGITPESILVIKSQDVTPTMEGTIARDAVKVGGKVLAIKTKPLDNGSANKALLTSPDMEQTLAGTDKSEEILGTVAFDTKDEKVDKVDEIEDLQDYMKTDGKSYRAHYMGELKGSRIGVDQKALYIAEAKYANWKINHALEEAHRDPSPGTTRMAESAMRERIMVDERFGLAPMSEQTRDSLDQANKTLAADPDKMQINVGDVKAMAEVMHEGDAAFQENIFKVLHGEMEEKIEMLEKEMRAEIESTQDPVERSGKETELATRKREIVSEYRGLFTTVASYYTFPLSQEIEQDMKNHEDEAYEAEGNAELNEDLTKKGEAVKGFFGLGYDEDGEPKMPGPNDRRGRF